MRGGALGPAERADAVDTPARTSIHFLALSGDRGASLHEQVPTEDP